MSFEIRYCQQDDFDSVVKLLRQLWPDLILDVGALHVVYSQAISTDRQKLIVGIADEQVVGFCSLTIKNNLWQAGNLGVVDELVVDSNYRGQGIGKKLMAHISKIALENKCKRIELDSSFHRKQAHRFYESIGFMCRAFWFSKVLNK